MDCTKNKYNNVNIVPNCHYLYENDSFVGCLENKLCVSNGVDVIFDSKIERFLFVHKIVYEPLCGIEQKNQIEPTEIKFQRGIHVWTINYDYINEIPASQFMQKIRDLFDLNPI